MDISISDGHNNVDNMINNNSSSSGGDNNNNKNNYHNDNTKGIQELYQIWGP